MSRRVFVAAAVACLGGFVVTSTFGGCSSLGLNSDVGDADLEATSSSSSGSSGGGSSSGIASSSGSGSSSGSASSGSGSSGGTGSSSGTCTSPLTAVPVNDVPAYVPVQPMPSACTTSQVVQYDTACSGGNATTCSAWYASSSNEISCAPCLNPGMNTDAGFIPSGTGATMFDGVNNAWPNLPGCVAVFDGNAGCASVLQTFIECAYYACNACRSSGGDMGACITLTETAACKDAYANVTSACVADYAPGGSLDPVNCNGQSGIGDTGAVAAIICSGGPPYDGGSGEAGSDASLDGASDGAIPEGSGDDSGG